MTKQLPVSITLEAWDNDYAYPLETVTVSLVDLLPAYDEEARESLAAAIFEDSNEADDVFFNAAAMGMVQHDGPFTVDLSSARSALEDEDWWDENEDSWDEDGEVEIVDGIVKEFNRLSPIPTPGLLNGTLQHEPVTPEVFYASARDGVVTTVVRVLANDLVGDVLWNKEDSIMPMVTTDQIEAETVKYEVVGARWEPQLALTVRLEFVL